MASVSGSKLSFFAPGLDPSSVNIVLNDGSGATPVAGKFNIEVFTATSPTSPDSGFQAGAVLQGATLVNNNTVVVGSPLTIPEQLLAGSYTVVDQSGNEDIRIIGAGAAPFSSITVVGSAGDTITGSSIASNSQTMDLTGADPSTKAGAMTVLGGAGNTTVTAGSGDVIVAGAGNLDVNGNAGDNNSIVGGSGSFTAFNFGANVTVKGGSGTVFIDDGYGSGGGNNSLSGGSASLNFVKGNLGDTIVGGSGASTLLAGELGSQSVIGGSGFSTIIQGGVGDTIIGGSSTFTQINGILGLQTITGSNGTIGTATLVLGGPNDKISGGTASLQVAGNAAANETISGGKGSLFAFNLGTGNTVTGSTEGTTVIDDSYGGGGGSKLVGGVAGSTIIGGSGDTIAAGTGALEVRVKTGFGSETIDLSASAGSDGVRDVNTGGPSFTVPGTNATVTGFATASDKIESATSVDSGGTFLGSSSVSGGNTTLTFLDGSTMTLVGVVSVADIKFTQ